MYIDEWYFENYLSKSEVPYIQRQWMIKIRTKRSGQFIVMLGFNWLLSVPVFVYICKILDKLFQKVLFIDIS